MTFPRIAFAIGLLVWALSAGAQTGERKVYIVQMTDAPLASYAGTLPGLAATRPDHGAKLDAESPRAQAYMRHLDTQRGKALGKMRNVKMLHKYNMVFNGFSAQLTEDEVAVLKKTKGVLSVTESEMHKVDTVSTPRFLGISVADGLWSQRDGVLREVRGEDVVIGMVDSGVWPENNSFSDKLGGALVYTSPPARWQGICQTGAGFTAAMCNNKLIGARYYVDGILAGGETLSVMEYRSPRDGSGHGSHTASTAGGNVDIAASINGVPVGAISGIAPRARIAVYKACWNTLALPNGACATADAVKAIDDAVADGVDVINFSIGGTQTNFVNPVEIAFFNAAAAGVFVAASAGNNGPSNQVAHISPWLATVAASTHDRFSVATVTLGNGQSFSGASFQTTGLPSTPLIRAINAGVAGADATNLRRCFGTADGGSALLDPAKVSGKIVVCDRGVNALVNKAIAVKAAGGIGMILQDVPGSNQVQVDQPYAVPTVHLSLSSNTAVSTYAGTVGATASFGPGLQQEGVIAPVMANFSSRGPNRANGNILKPDITGPGVSVIAAYVDTSLTQAQHDALVLNNFTPQPNANVLSGTSMSSPHIAGAAALLKQLYPSWSPAAIKSALMTSTTEVKLSTGAVDTARFGYGAGHVNPNGSANPGLVYDAGTDDYGRFLCGLGLTPPMGAGTCATLGAIQPWNLNLASLTAFEVPGKLTLTRKVTNVTGAAAVFNATASLPGWDVAVTPASLTLDAGASASFDVTLTRTSAAIGAQSFGNLTWSDGVREVRSPLSARGVLVASPVEVSDTRVSGRGSKIFTVTTGYDGTLSVVPTGLVAATLSPGSVASNQRQCFDFTVPAGAQLARFQLFNTDTQGGAATDLDIELFGGSNGTGTLLGAARGGGSDERITFINPPRGISACVLGFATPAGGASYTLSSWIVGPAVGVQSLRASGPSAVYLGGTASIGLSWSVLAGKRYLGNVQFRNAANTLLDSTIVFVDNR